MPNNPFLDAARKRADKPVPSPFVEARDRRDVMRGAALEAANDVTPDQAAEFGQLADQTGLTYEQVHQHPDMVRDTVKRRSVREQLRDAPVLSQFVSNPRNAALSQDSLENLAKLEAAIRGDDGKTGKGVFGSVANVGTGIGQRTVDLFLGLAGASGTVLTEVEARALYKSESERQQVRDRGHYKDGLDILRNGLSAPYPGNEGVSIESLILGASEEGDSSASGLLEKVAGSLDFNYTPGKDWEEVKNDPVGSFIPWATETGLVSIPDMVAAVYALPAYVAARTGELGQTRAENDTRNAATVEDLASVLPASVGSAMLERFGARGVLGLDDVVRGSGVGEVAGAVGVAALKESITEGAQEGLESVAETLGTERGFSLPETAERAFAGSLAGGFFGGAIRTPTAAYEARQHAKNKLEEAQTQQAAETISALRESVEETPLFQRDQAALQEFLSEATDGETVLLDGMGLSTLYQSEPAAFQEIADTLGLSEEQIIETFNGGDVEVEVAKLLTFEDRAGFDQLLEIARTSPEALTLQEVRAQQEEQLLSVDYQDAFERFEEQDRQLEGFERAQRSVRDQLVAAGRTQEEASAAGTLFGSFFRVLSDAGLDEAQVFERLGLRIDGPSTPSRQPDVTLNDGTVYTAEDITALREQAGVTIPNKPQPLGAFVRSIGLDPSSVFEGEVGEIDTTGLIDRAGGQDLDVIAQRAADEGYLPLDENGKADVATFLESLAADYRAFQAGGERVFRPGDSDAVAGVSAQQDARALLDEVDAKIAEQQGAADGVDTLEQFIGERSQDPIVQQRLAKAKELEAQGFDRDVIWQRTLAYRGVDGKWRAEIDDSGVELSDSAIAARADKAEISGDQLLEGSGIAASYPDLLEGISVLVEFATDKSKGRYNAKSNELDLETKTDEDTRSLALHELQHAIQVIEGFAYGGSATLKTPFIAAREKQALVKKTTALANRALQGIKGRTEERQELITQLDSEVRDLQDKVQRASGLTPYEFYKRLAGEVEAYNVQARQDMSIEERRETPPWATQEFDEAEQFIRVLGKDVLEERDEKLREAAREKVEERVQIEASMLAAAAKCAGGGTVGQMVAGNLAGLSIGGTGAAIFAYSAGSDERRLEAIRFHQQNLSSADIREERAKSAKLEASVAEDQQAEADALNRYERALEAHYSDINNMPDDPRFDVNGWAEKFTGIDAAYLDALVGHEAGDDWDAQAVTSSAQGGAQFISSTWRTWLSKYGSKYGEHPDPYSNDSEEKEAALALRNDRRWGTMIAAEFTRENVLFLQNELERPVTGKEAYLAHFLGRDQALKMLKADPASDAAAGFPREADSNRPVFYKGCRSFECNIDGLTPRTVREVIAKQGRAFPSQTIFPYSEPIT